MADDVDRTGSADRPTTRSPRRRRVAYAARVLAIAVAIGAVQLEIDRRFPGEADTSFSPDRTMRAFSADSWWNTPLPEDAPTHPAGRQILRYLRTGPGSGPGCVLLAGTRDPRWGTPIYWAEPTDPEYNLERTGYWLPPELDELRIPVEARRAVDGDGTMTVYDVDKGYVVALTNASYDGTADVWSATGGTVTYLDSNGLHRRTKRSDDFRNDGTHMGNNGATWAVSWDQVQTGEIGHVLKIASGPTVARRFIFPLVRSDGTYTGSDPAVPPGGIRLRIKSSVDLDALELPPAAEVIAEALQRYGVYIGGSGGRTALKVENTEAEGRGQLWTLSRDALCGMPLHPRYWEVIAESFDPTRSVS